MDRSPLADVVIAVDEENLVQFVGFRSCGVMEVTVEPVHVLFALRRRVISLSAFTLAATALKRGFTQQGHLRGRKPYHLRMPIPVRLVLIWGRGPEGLSRS